MIPALILFGITYILMIVFTKYRPYIALASGVVFIVSGMLPLGNIWDSIDFNVILMIAGTMGLVALFTESKMPALLADLVMEKVPNIKWAAVALALFAGFVSAFIDNVATVLMVAPIALAIAKKFNIVISVLKFLGYGAAIVMALAALFFIFSGTFIVTAVLLFDALLLSIGTWLACLSYEAIAEGLQLLHDIKNK